jgi:hypothetical protein
MTVAVIESLQRELTETNNHYIEEGLKRRTAEARIQELEAGIHKVIAACDECEGKGYNVLDDGDGDIEKDPCNSCWDLRNLIGDHTDYQLLEAELAPPAAAVGMCPEPLCTLQAGHEWSHDDIPF